MIYVFVGQFVALNEWRRQFPLRPEDQVVHFLSNVSSLRGLRGKAKLVEGHGAFRWRLEDAEQEVAMMNAMWSPEPIDVPF